jgi:hypothetical protein
MTTIKQLVRDGRALVYVRDVTDWPRHLVQPATWWTGANDVVATPRPRTSRQCSPVLSVHSCGVKTVCSRAPRECPGRGSGPQRVARSRDSIPQRENDARAREGAESRTLTRCYA